MNWKAKRALAVVILTAVSSVAAGYLAFRYHNNEQIRAEMHAKALVLKDEIDRRFPAGTPRAHFMEFADKWPGWRGENSGGYWISIGQEPSRVWYCGPFEVGVVVGFKGDRVTDTRIATWGLNCP
jgi:hypothetical protein